ncbi:MULTISPECIES: carboxynorspermidine decarboxylase [Campylobacter]|uniref:Carboxynorspermidine decarboxylase n=1 Tax=Campylobacter molothri TaxID=1032242 RepID=A0ACC5VZC9_9BACT|nr:carboxynorspermidine decarboxylase [Campylobacter sp. RM12910]MBZ7932401.1 carboxynorspermidine decarboxylase [Campylobacter sp. RM10543]MBZ7934401.1 carboxynorspermidine decarboxylase [Campylobacter sp. W0065]MBZ7947156.1 carboxynorspermidine decarboxylase [Campylobacter sp. RM10536]MBZ7947603.1 carboxynorspermidine decarboxylase [Campylobacter sp. RM9929]MBZ7951996.1 carboxynorspermidine decarboxylase [Campylobacter sp. RM9939]MBZ7957452.1 carboxynorspermidine decarboxylase [Campylobacte
MYEKIQTPAYILEEDKLRKNCELLAYVGEKSGAKILLALKGFAFSGAMKIVGEYLQGCTCSGLWEAQFAKEYMDKEIHTYSPAFKDDEIETIASLSHHIVFNSLYQFEKYKNICTKNSLGLRCNLEFSLAPKELYNPCGRYSRLGIRAKDLIDANLRDIEGLHFHALCEESAEALEQVLKVFENNFSSWIKNMKWVNFGGGHHITKKGYNVQKLIDLCKKFSDKYGVKVYLEPGEAIGWQTGVLVASVIDLIENEKKIAILDTSSEAHMPDTIIMPYTSEVQNARILSTRDSENISSLEKDEIAYLLTGNTCLAGDVMGEYAFKKELKRGDKVVFLDQIHYSIVKNTTFNGIRLPNLIFLDQNKNFKTIRKFTYEDYAKRN